ncbi:MAG: mycothiol transferase [Mycobacteriaceae bacterium]|uniref:mycothiol transferase n=1 Tax=Corynebacterium sp. TaxID=1720 RepID=UPI003F959B85
MDNEPTYPDAARLDDSRLDAFLAVAGEILDGYDTALDTLDDTTVNTTPVPGTVNSAFALVSHVRGMAYFWGGSFVAGEVIARDRDAEFRATGTVGEAHQVIGDVRRRLPGWASIALTEGIRNREAKGTSRRDMENATPEWVLDHILHELAQHLGHLEICRDVVVAEQ